MTVHKNLLFRIKAIHITGKKPDVPFKYLYMMSGVILFSRLKK